MTSRGSSKESRPPKAVIVCGPTGSGKSNVGIGLAERYGGTIIGADSRQIYRLLDIGTAKPTPEDRARVKHYLIDVADVGEDFSARRYVEFAAEAIVETSAQGKIPFIVGGAGLYLEALTAGLFAGPDKDESIREELNETVRKNGPESLHAELEKIDPLSAERISPNDTVRVIRALEVYRLTGKNLSHLQRDGEYSPPLADFLWIGLTFDRKKLYARINDRVDRMIADGLIDEIRGLLRLGLGNPIIRKRIVGYYELINALENRISLPDAISLVKQHSRNYAKRQLTWFRNKAPVIWLDPTRSGFPDILHQAIDHHLGKMS